MKPVRRSERAEQDLIDIWQQIAAKDMGAADRLLDRIDQKCRLLADYPQAGPERHDIGPEVRYTTAGRYIILYRVEPRRVFVARIVYGARNLAAAFRE